MWDTPSDTEQPAAPVNLPAQVVAPELPDPVIPVSLDDATLSSLAIEIVRAVNEPLTIIKNFGITPEQFEVIKQNPFFVKTLEVVTTVWTSTDNIDRRSRLTAAAILEEVMPKLGARMLKEGEPLPAVIETAKLFAKMAGVGEAPAAGTVQPGEKFNIVINIGEKQVNIAGAQLANAPVDA